jgi:hypothetical protein
MIPDPTQDTYILIDKVNLVDTTLNTFAAGYTEEEVQKIFLFFRSLALGLASRNAALTSGVFCTSGGSRTEYRYHPKFGINLENALVKAYTIIDIGR